MFLGWPLLQSGLVHAECWSEIIGKNYSAMQMGIMNGGGPECVHEEGTRKNWQGSANLLESVKWYDSIQTLDAKNIEF